VVVAVRVPPVPFSPVRVASVRVRGCVEIIGADQGSAHAGTVVFTVPVYVVAVLVGNHR
jgi:hypothetical protein